MSCFYLICIPVPMIILVLCELLMSLRLVMRDLMMNSKTSLSKLYQINSTDMISLLLRIFIKKGKSKLRVMFMLLVD